MSFELDFSAKAIEDLDYHKKSGNIAITRKILSLLEEISEHPFQGTGKPEALKHGLSGKWSRRINKEHRIIYAVLENSINIYSVKGHY